MGSSGKLQVVLRTGDEAVAAQVGRLTDLAGVGLLVVPPDRVLPAARRFHYSNLGYVMLGELVAERAGKPLEEMIRVLLPQGE